MVDGVGYDESRLFEEKGVVVFESSCANLIPLVSSGGILRKLRVWHNNPPFIIRQEYA